MKVLVVDDHQFNRELLGFILEDHSIDFCEATTGVEAIAAVAADEKIDLVLMDVNMPEMDGYEATREIKARFDQRFLPIIFVTALDDDETLAKCLSVGGDDFIGKPVNENVLMAKLKAHGRTLDYHRQLRETNRQLHYHQMLMDREHAIVDHILQSGIQRSDSSCDNVRFRFMPMSMFNGDMLLVAPSPSGGVYILLGDFTGHGLSAAIGCLPVADIFYAMTAKQASVGEMAAEMNRRLQYLLPSNMFLCAALLELNHSGDRLCMWSGGLNDMLLVDEQGEICQRLSAQHMPLGILDDSEFDKTVRLIKPPRGSKLYAYTDGVIETHSPSEEWFGEERLEALFATPCEDRIAQIFDAIEAWREGAPQDDDISLVELLCDKVTHHASEDAGGSVLPPATSEQMSLPWRIRVPLTANYLKEHEVVPQLLQVVVNIQGLSVHQDLLYTILTELYNNALEHGILRLSSVDKHDVEGFSRYYSERAERLAALDHGIIQFELEVIPGAAGEPNKLVFSLTDDGPGFDYQSRLSAEPCGEHSFGRGLALAESLCDKLEYSEGGRKVEVTYSLS